ncbi:MAG TPA: 50S ribosomal protein L25/general stress protein Ctc [Gammaproteobacteria bacterium]|nr:50S ribosomal protein L25/general stress protein Ctc [Gammaproteobacteria bacterium]
MSNFTLNAELRSDTGKGASRRLRHKNAFPAVIYGGDADPQLLTLNHDDIVKSLENEAIYTSILTINIDGKGNQAVIKDIQRHAYKPKVLHMDFQRVSRDEKIHMHVPIHFLNGENAPGVKAGGQMTHNMSDIEVSCLAKDLPEYIEIDVSKMEMGDTLHISDLALPDGVVSVELIHGSDHDQPIVAIHKSRGMSDGDSSEATEAETPSEE